MDNYKLVETFSEFKEFKNIDREAMMRIIEDVFRGMLIVCCSFVGQGLKSPA